MGKLINEAKRLQQLAGILKEEIEDSRYRYHNAEAKIEIELTSEVNPDTEEANQYNVTFFGYVMSESGAFDYEYGSIRGTHDPGVNIYVEDIWWDKSKYTNDENKNIEKWLDENTTLVEDKLIKDYEKNYD